MKERNNYSAGDFVENFMLGNISILAMEFENLPKGI